jgi:prepilin-type N-terminal cleavage/methylation domain-containing protein
MKFKICQPKFKQGFTFIEFLVVLVIIGIVISLSVVALSSVKAKNRDAKRVSDIRQIQTALEMYYNRNNSYPDSLTPGSPLVSEGKTYLQEVPSAPNNPDGSCTSDDYTYTVDSGGMSYHIGYCLGGIIQGISSGNLVAVPGQLDVPVAAAAIFVPTTTVKVLVVAGGGGGAGGGTSAGGGAGGLVYNGATNFYDGDNTVTVGDGGTAGATTGDPRGGNGGDSVFGTITATGGGGGGGGVTNSVNTYIAGKNGGSGGGGAAWWGAGAKGTGVAGQGYNGSDGVDASPYKGGGGGGAGGAAGVPGSTTGGAGGIGLAYDISGTSLYYAGGGGGGVNGVGTGGTGGSGVGGNGSANSGTATAGTANRGGGGGGAGGATIKAGGAGGSGVVVVSYPNGTLVASGGTVTTSGGNTIHTFTTPGSSTFTIIPVGGQLVTPTFSPVAGSIAFGSTVTITSPGADAIYYTTDGSTPTTASTNQATTPLVINSAITVKAIAVKAGFTNSAVGSATYTDICDDTTVSTFSIVSVTPRGTYSRGNALTAGNYLEVVVNVTCSGTYTLSAATVNGFSFSGSGSFATAGSATINIPGTGTPTAASASNFTLTDTSVSQAFSITPTTLTAVIASINSITITGTYFKNKVIPYYGNPFWYTASSNVTVTQAGTASVTYNGLTGCSMTTYSGYVGIGTSNLSATVIQGTPANNQTYTITASGNGASATTDVTVLAQDATDVTSGMVAEWKMDGNSNDTLGNNNCTTNNISYVTDGMSQAAVFSTASSSAFYKSSPTSLYNPITSAYTVSMWVKISPLSGTQMLFNYAQTTTKGQYLYLNNSQLTYYVASGGTHSVNYTGGPSAGVWTHLVFKTTGTPYLYTSWKNGTPYNYSSASGGGTIGAITPNLLSIGSGSFSTQATNYINGRIDEVRIYNRELTETEILSLYNYYVANGSF